MHASHSDPECPAEASQHAQAPGSRGRSVVERVPAQRASQAGSKAQRCGAHRPGRQAQPVPLRRELGGDSASRARARVIVLDASAAADYLLDAGTRGEWARAQVAGADSLHAPDLLDYEVV